MAFKAANTEERSPFPTANLKPPSANVFPVVEPSKAVWSFDSATTNSASGSKIDLFKGPNIFQQRNLDSKSHVHNACNIDRQFLNALSGYVRSAIC